MEGSRKGYIPIETRRAHPSISDKSLDEFIAIYKEEYGEELSRTEATEMAHRVLALYKLLARKLSSGRKVPPSATQQEVSEEDDHRHA